MPTIRHACGHLHDHDVIFYNDIYRKNRQIVGLERKKCPDCDLKDLRKKSGEQSNLSYGLEILQDYNYKKISDDCFRIGDFDFWPTTGLFINRVTNKKFRGINNLLPLIEKFKMFEGLIISEDL